MWTLLSTREQLLSLKIDDLILQYPTNEDVTFTNPTGQEENSNIYKINSLMVFEVTLESLPKNYIFGDILINSMKKKVDINQLLNGTWWIK